MWSRDPLGPRVEKQLFRIRTGTFYTSELYARIKWLPSRYMWTCPCCEEQTPETIDHMLFECAAWSIPRQRFLSRCGRLWPGAGLSGDKLSRVVGDYPTSLAAVGLAKAFAEAKLDWEREHVLSRGWVRARRPMWDFLCDIWPRRQRLLDPLIDVCKSAMQSTALPDPRVEAPSGRTGVHCHRGTSGRPQR